MREYNQAVEPYLSPHPSPLPEGEGVFQQPVIQLYKSQILNCIGIPIIPIITLFSLEAKSFHQGKLDQTSTF
jgi:hypothetical protein